MDLKPCNGKQTLLYWWGGNAEAELCEGILCPSAISAHFLLQIEEFILVLMHFQRNVNANKIITKLCFKFPWGQYCCCHVWKPNLCQRMSMQQYLLTCPLLRRCRAIRKQMVERKLWSSLRKPFDSTNCCKQCSASLIVIVWGWEGFKLSRLLPVGWFLGMANGHRAIA